MSPKYKLAFGFIVVAQLALLLTFIGVKEYRLQTGTTVVLQTVPVDPRSLLQGDFAILRYRISTLPGYLSNLGQGSTAYVILVERDDVWTAVRHTISKPSLDEVFIKGRVDAGGELDFGIGTYFVPEGTGHIIEQARDVKVKVSVSGSGSASRFSFLSPSLLCSERKAHGATAGRNPRTCFGTSMAVTGRRGLVVVCLSTLDTPSLTTST